MKKFFTVLIFGLTFGSGVLVGGIAPLFAENKASESLSTEEANRLVKEYLLDCFRKYINGNEDVSEVSCTADYDASDGKTNLYFAQGRFRNFRANNKVFSGRFETKAAVKMSGFLFNKKPVIDPRDQSEPITLYVNDQLSGELRDTLVKDYVDKAYNNPLGFEIHNERLQVFPDKIYSYVTFLFNKSKIVYLRAVFERGAEIVNYIGKLNNTETPMFITREIPWSLNRGETIVEREFPRQDQIMKDIQEPLYNYVSADYLKNARGTTLPKSSKVEAIETQPSDWLREANGEHIQLDIQLRYVLDKWGLPGSFEKYRLEHVIVIYKFDLDSEGWKFVSLDTGRINKQLLGK